MRDVDGKRIVDLPPKEVCPLRKFNMKLIQRFLGGHGRAGIYSVREENL